MGAPFVFQPAGGELRAPAFSGFFRALATLFVSGVASWMLHLWRTGRLVPEGAYDA